MKKITTLLVLLATFALANAQTPNGTLASVNYTQSQKTERTANGNHALGLSYSRTTTGLNYVTASVLIETRSQPYSINVNGSGFPTHLTITGLPAGATIKAAFLYVGLSYTEATVPATIAAAVTNPSSSLTNYSDSLIGQDGPVCWGETGTAMYRCLINSCITGNGTYQLNITGLNNPAWEVDGATMLIAYVDNSATYTGTLVLYDGIASMLGGGFSTTVTGFTGCTGPSNYAQAFVLGADIQNNVGTFSMNLNSSTASFSRDFWDVYTLCTTISAGQTSALYSIDSGSISGDCYFVGMCGLYFQACSPSHCTLGVTEQIKSDEINIYPNPVKNTLEVAISQKIDGEITITDVLGQTVYSGKVSNGEGTDIKRIDLSSLPNGLYILTLQSGSQRLEKKIVKMF